MAGSRADAPARLVDPAEPIQLQGDAPRFVSRGGEKLAAALERLRGDVAGRRALDLGASTGGFTDCLLQAGAATVVAVDVGRGQLAWALRTDTRVSLLERTNARNLEPEHIGGAVDLVVADLSFISLRTVAPALVRCTHRGRRSRAVGEAAVRSGPCPRRQGRASCAIPTSTGPCSTRSSTGWPTPVCSWSR